MFLLKIFQDILLQAHANRYTIKLEKQKLLYSSRLLCCIYVVFCFSEVLTGTWKSLEFLNYAQFFDLPSSCTYPFTLHKTCWWFSEYWGMKHNLPNFGFVENLLRNKYLSHIHSWKSRWCDVMCFFYVSLLFALIYMFNSVAINLPLSRVHICCLLDHYGHLPWTITSGVDCVNRLDHQTEITPTIIISHIRSLSIHFPKSAHLLWLFYSHNTQTQRTHSMIASIWWCIIYLCVNITAMRR